MYKLFNIRIFFWESPRLLSEGGTVAVTSTFIGSEWGDLNSSQTELLKALPTTTTPAAAATEKR